MLRLALRRILYAIPVLLLVSLAVLLLAELVPGDPAYTVAGENATPQQVATIHEQLGLDQSLPERYANWVWRAAQGDLGTTLLGNLSVSDQILERIPITLELAILALLMALLISMPIAMYSAYRPDSWFDRGSLGASSVLISSPSFLTGTLLVTFVCVQWRLFPAFGWVPISEDLGDNLYHAFLPAFVLAIVEVPTFIRILRGDLVATLQEDYVLSARAKGMSPRYVLVRHALRPSLFALVTVAGLSTGRLIGGALLVEQIFAINGLGSMAVQSVGSHDFAALQGLVLFVAVVYMLMNLGVDLLYAYLDPRVRARV